MVTKKKKKKSIRFEVGLIERLKEDKELAVEYLNAALEDADEGSDERFLFALRHVAQAYGISRVAAKSGMARQAIYRALSENGNPEFASLRTLLNVLGLRLAVESKAKAS